MRAGSLSRDVPHQRRARNQTTRQRRQANACVMRKNLHRSIVAPQDYAALRRQQRPVERFCRLTAYLIDGNRTIDVLLQQLVGADQVELIILFQHGRALGIGHGFECDRGRIDQCSHISEAHRVAALG